MNRQKNVEIKGIFSMICILFGAFLLIPMIMILQKSFMGNEGFTLEFYKDILGADFLKIFINSVGIAMASAVITTMLAFVLAYSIHFTNIPAPAKKGIHLLAVMPNAFTDNYLWICNYLFAWKTGAFDKAFWQTVI